MSVYFIRRMMQTVFVLMAMAVIVFVGIYAIGNPIDFMISPEADQAEIEAAIRRLGLDKPMYEQFWLFVVNALQGDLGDSFVHNEPALRLILERLPATMELALFSVFLSIFLGIPLGMIAGFRPHSMTGKSIMAGSILGFSLPTFWVGLMMILLFAVFLGVLPASGRGETVEFLGMHVSFLTWDGFTHLLMPAVNLGLFKLSLVIRLSRAGTREVLLQDYIKFARAKGISNVRLILTHVLKNILIPVVTVIGLELGSVIAFAVVTETIFAWPGMGKLLIDSILHLDRPVVVAYLLLTVFMFIIINFIVDVLYSILDPRVRLSEAK
ncbi:MAG: ABC transporter permease [Rhodospirillales bacterium]|nr:ABC transporter permease [Rhodospirillales bacterium]